IRMGYGSVHGGIEDYRYKPWDPDFYRGHHSSIYPRTSKGFVFHYMQDQADAHNESIMLMDRQRAPTDPQDTQAYRLERANHSTRTGPEAAGANIIQFGGSGRWMPLAHIWGQDDWMPYYYG